MPKKKDILVFGAGGHAKVVIDVLEQAGGYRVVGLLDDNVELHRRKRWDLAVLGGREYLAELHSRGLTRLIVALGDNRLRHIVFEEASKAGFQLESAIHPSVQLGKRVTIGVGSVMVAGAVVNVDSCVGENVIVNTGATVDHDCRIEAHAHLSPGVHLGGQVTIGELAHIGIGAVVLPGLAVGRNSIVGAGAVVIQDVPPGVVVAGNPACEIPRYKGEEGTYAV